MIRHTAFLALSFATAGTAVSAPAAAEAAAPAPAPTPAAPKAVPLKAFLGKLPGTWTGMQYMRSPSAQIMPVEMRESYAWEKGVGGAPDVLVGELTYTVKSGGTRRVFNGKSRTWIDKDGRGRSEVTQHGEMQRFTAFMRVDTLVFVPEGRTEKPQTMTTVHFVNENGAEAMEVRGFQTGPEGTYLVKGLLKRGESPVVAGPNG